MSADERYWLYCVKSFEILEVINLPSHTSPNFPARHVNPARIKQWSDVMCPSCFLGSLFTRQLDFLHCDVQIRAAWEADVISEKSKLFPRSFYTAARHWVKNLNKNWFLDHQQYKQPLMKSFRVKVNSEICILASKASGNWNRGKGKCLMYSL